MYTEIVFPSLEIEYSVACEDKETFSRTRNTMEYNVLKLLSKQLMYCVCVCFQFDSSNSTHFSINSIYHITQAVFLWMFCNYEEVEPV